MYIKFRDNLCSVFLIKPQCQKTIVSTSVYQLKRLPLQQYLSRPIRFIPHVVHAALYIEKLNLFKQIVFLSGQSAVSKVTTSVRSAVFRPFTQAHNRFAAHLLPCRLLLEVSPEIRCSDVSNRYCCYDGNHATGSKPI